MKKLVTTWMLLLMAALTIQTTQAQTVTTVAEINAIPQAGIDAVAALGANVTSSDLTTHIRSPFTGETVQFTGVVLSDPLLSGLSSVNDNTNNPSRIHFWVRDEAAATDGFDGQVIQVVDGDFLNTGTLDLFVGDVLRLTGQVAYFGSGMQFSPSAVEFLGSYADRGHDESILEPVTITLDELNVALGDNMARANWDNFSALNQQYVRIEGLQVFSSPNRFASRPNWALRDLDTGAVIDNDDISLAYRNDRTDYPDPFRAENNFEGPAVGAIVDVQGFALLSRTSSFDPHSIGDPVSAIMRIVPWEPSDLVVVESPPIITDITPPVNIPGNSPITITASIVADQSRTLTGASLTWSSTSDATGGTVTGTNTTGDTFSFQIPAQPNRDFVTFSISASDSEGSESVSADRFIRVLFGGITAIRDIQEPAPETGDSPFADVTTSMDLEVTVMTDPAVASGSTGLMSVQDGISPWSGIALRTSGNPLLAAGVEKGDVIRITSGKVVENFGFTMIRDFQFEIVSQGGDPYDAVVVTSELLADADVAESLEGMMLRVENATIVATDADASDPSGPHGEFAISNGVGSIRVNDLSSAISYEGGDPGTVFAEGQVLAFVEGVLYYSFSNFKLEPESFDAIGPVTNVSTESDVLPLTTSLSQNFPNPFNPTTSIQYDVATTGQVTLSVYDALGRHVETLVSSEQPAGTYAVQFDASRLSSGLYLYRLQTADKMVTRTMTLLK